MRRLLSSLGAVALVLTTAAGGCSVKTPKLSELLVIDTLIIEDPKVPITLVITPSSQAVFDSAIARSRDMELETGGCATLVAKVGSKFWIAEAKESTRWRRPLSVQVDCSDDDIIWHTHWVPESDTTAGCRGSGWDVDSTRRRDIGIVVCGVGRDSAIGYHRARSRLIGPSRWRLGPRNR